MTNASTPYTDEEQVSAQADTTVIDVIVAWEQYFHSLKVKFRTHTDLAVADFRLTLKALVVTLFCILSLVAVATVTWVVALTAVYFAITALGAHWSIGLLCLVGLNALLGWGITISLRKALACIDFSATWNTLFSPSTEQDEA